MSCSAVRVWRGQVGMPLCHRAVAVQLLQLNHSVYCGTAV